MANDPSTKALVARDLRRCSVVSLKRNPSSYASPLVEMASQRMEALRTFIPKHFSDNFNNPCWNVTMRAVPKQLYGSLIDKSGNLDASHYPSQRSAVMSYFKDEDKFPRSTYKNYFFCLPRFYLAGFPKSGTTTLFIKMIANRLVAKPSRKEGHFWRTFIASESGKQSKQLQVLWYLFHLYPGARSINYEPNALTFDGSASTIILQNPSGFLSENPTEEEVNTDLCVIPSFIYNLTPDAKFVVIMRNPVKRLYSDFWYFCANHKWREHNNSNAITVPEAYAERAPQLFHSFALHAVESFQLCIENRVPVFECVSTATTGYKLENSEVEQCIPIRLGVSMYYFHIVKWLSVFPRDNFLFLRTEDMAVDSYETVTQVWSFLGLEPVTRERVKVRDTANQMDWIRSDDYKDKFYMLPETQRLLEGFYRPYNKMLSVLLGDDERYLWE